MSRFLDFVRSDAGALARFRQRSRRRVRVLIDDIEPQSKKMPGGERDKFQATVADQMALARRSAFRKGVALRLDLATTSRTAPQAHTIAKNLLDLLGEKRAGVDWPGRHLLYADDKQIQALSVSCRHGERNPGILIEARPFAAMLDDLELAAEATRIAEMTGDGWHRADQDSDAIDAFRDLRRNEPAERERLGDELYDSIIKMTRWSAQRALLSRSRLTIPVLSWLYGLPRGVASGFGSDTWVQLLSQSRLRLQVGELPVATGGSSAFKQAISAEIRAFKQRWDWLISPLVIAVALEVVVRPNPSTPAAVLHDLDNIVRDYLLPSIVPEFGTVTDHRWTIDFDELKLSNPKLAEAWGASPTPPRGTKSGVTRYEAWRLPAVAGEPGFVSVALVADTDGSGGLMSEVDAVVQKWTDELRL